MCTATWVTGAACAHLPNQLGPGGVPVPLPKEEFKRHGTWVFDKCGIAEQRGDWCCPKSQIRKPTYKEMTADMNNPKYDFLPEARRENPNQPDAAAPHHMIDDLRCPICRQVDVEGIQRNKPM
jgi:hypothetical protein